MPRDMARCLDAGYTGQANTDGPSSEYDHDVDVDGDSDSFNYPVVQELGVVILLPYHHSVKVKRSTPGRTKITFSSFLPHDQTVDDVDALEAEGMSFVNDTIRQGNTLLWHP